MPIFSLEKTTQAILKKFENKSEYEDRKIVFWYDRDTTAGDEDLEYIKANLLENGIKTFILKNNFFETKKLLEHDDTKTDYLIYSPEAERDYEQNWLLDIQLYSERFENSRISDVKSEIGVDGYTFDNLLEKHQKFFASKKRVAAFTKNYRKEWTEESIILGMLTAITGSSVDDPREIVRNLLMRSLNEVENDYWDEITGRKLLGPCWTTIRIFFRFSNPEKTLPEFYYHAYR